jgi:hypothetical protein
MKRTAAVALVGLTLATSGCVMEMDMDSEPETEEVESAITILPVAGTWTYGETTQVSGTCNASITQIESGPFQISSVTATGYRITPNDGTAPFTCTSNATEGFRCPNRATAFIDLRRFFDAQLTIRASATGQFIDSRRAVGKQDFVVTCVGTKCHLVGPSPCGYVVNFEVHHGTP